MEQTILAVAAGAGRFETLTRAVRSAGLAEMLSGTGPFTVFAPTDEAFARLPGGMLEAVLADPKKARALVTYHVLPGRVTAEDVVKAGAVKPGTVQGESLDVRLTRGAVKVNDATVVTPDVEASNGVIHEIDRVVVPEALAWSASC